MGRYFTLCVSGTLFGRRAKRARRHLFMSMESRDILEKWFPLQGERGHSSYFRSFQKQNREEEETERKKQPINLPMVITFSTDYKYTT